MERHLRAPMATWVQKSYEIFLPINWFVLHTINVPPTIVLLIGKMPFLSFSFVEVVYISFSGCYPATICSALVLQRPFRFFN